MNCKGCNKNIYQDNYKKIADWIFCFDCFDSLMNRTGPKQQPAQQPEFQSEPQTDESQGTESPDSELKTKNQSNTCKICNIGIDKGKEKKLGIWTLCEACHNDLTFKPEKKMPPEPSDNTQADNHGDDARTLDQGPVNRNETIICHDCGRDILVIAAKEEDGNFLCPDCFYSKGDI